MAPVDIQDEQVHQNGVQSSRIEKQCFKKTVLHFLLGEDLACSKNLGVFKLFFLADFLAFTVIFIPYGII
jgi:hypothetical protein